MLTWTARTCSSAGSVGTPWEVACGTDLPQLDREWIPGCGLFTICPRRVPQTFLPLILLAKFSSQCIYIVSFVTYILVPDQFQTVFCYTPCSSPPSFSPRA